MYIYIYIFIYMYMHIHMFSIIYMLTYILFYATHFTRFRNRRFALCFGHSLRVGWKKRVRTVREPKAPSH